MGLTGDELDGFTFRKRYADRTFIRLMIRRTAGDAYPSGWRYALHYGAVAPDAVDRPTTARSDDTTMPTKPRRATNSMSRPIQSRKRSSFPAWSSCTTGSGRKSRKPESTREAHTVIQ